MLIIQIKLILTLRQIINNLLFQKFNFRASLLHKVLHRQQIKTNRICDFKSS